MSTSIPSELAFGGCASTIQLTRREFLKLGGLGLLGSLIPTIGHAAPVQLDLQGRIIAEQITIYVLPLFNSQEIKVYWKDMVIPITAATVGDEEPAYNRIWYRIGEEGYAHSGMIQPVRTQTHPPAVDIPPTGALAEVTVPYTDAHWGPGKNFPFAYRFYYETTYWIISQELGTDGRSWYRIQDDKWDHFFYAPASHLRLIPAEELQPISAGAPPEAKRLEVRTGEQVVIAYENDQPVFMARAATGAEFSNGRFYTPSGQHKTFHKRPSRHMAAGNLALNGYDLPGVPWISYITESGVAFHGTYWHNDFGRPRSHGCINLTSRAAKWIYRWTLPTVPTGQQFVYEKYGTIVDVV